MLREKVFIQIDLSAEREKKKKKKKQTKQGTYYKVFKILSLFFCPDSQIYSTVNCFM